MADSVSDGVQKPKKNPVPKGLTPFTPMNAKQAQEASVRSRNLRKQVRAEMLDTLVNNLNFGQEMLKAIKKGDIDQINLLQTAMKIVGLTHDQSEDAIQKIDIKSENKTNLVGGVQIEFTEAPKA